MTDLIAFALSPGIALTSVIFYSTSLMNRFVYITGRARELNKEARQLRAEAPVKHRLRLESIRWQVRLLTHRSRIIRRSVLVVYVALFSFILTILELLLLGLFHWPAMDRLPLATFALGFVALGVSAIFSWHEMVLGQSTIVEDTRFSFPDGLEEPVLEREVLAAEDRV